MERKLGIDWEHNMKQDEELKVESLETNEFLDGYAEANTPEQENVL